MKTKELIRRLQEADPSGEEEVCVGNVDIHFVENVESYWDGSAQVLHRNEKGRLSGGKYKRSGRKIQVHTYALSDLVLDRPWVEIDYSELDESRAEDTRKNHDKMRAWMVRMKNRLELDLFIRWVKETAEKVTADVEDAEEIAKRFFMNEELTRDTPLPEGCVPQYTSYTDTRKKQWEEKYGDQIRKEILGDWSET